MAGLVDSSPTTNSSKLTPFFFTFRLLITIVPGTSRPESRLCPISKASSVLSKKVEQEELVPTYGRVDEKGSFRGIASTPQSIDRLSCNLISRNGTTCEHQDCHAGSNHTNFEDVAHSFNS